MCLYVYTLRALHNLSLCIYCTVLYCTVGAFGKVYSGILNNPANEMVDMTVAVKTIKSK